MDIPKKITPCPIYEAILEIRFESEMPADAIFGVAYTALKDKFPKHKKLPILQVPEAIRTRDSNFRFKPYYQITNENFVFQIGPDVFSLCNINEYVGWEEYSKKIKESFLIISGLDIIKRVLRFSVRYINYFRFNIFDKIDLEMILKHKPLQANKLNIRAEIESGNCLNILQLGNNIEIQIAGEMKVGSVIDIDTILNKEADNFFENFNSLSNELHVEEKKLFFNLLKPEYLETLNPEY